MARVVEFRVLGPLEAVVDGDPVSLAAAKPRTLLAVLLLSRNRVVPVDELIAELWGDDPPDTAMKALQVYVSQLRKTFGADRVLTKAPGYSMRVEDGELDLDRFEQLVREGRERLAEGKAEAAAEKLGEALALWRGPALPRLEESRLAALEDRIEAELTLGRHARLVPELEQLVARHPLSERLRSQLMLALYRSGRQAEALEVYRRTREVLVDELGIEPSPALQELERAILRHDPSLRRGRPEAAAAAPVAVPAPRPRRGRLLVLGLVVLAAAVAAAALALTRGGGSGAQAADLRPFVLNVENFLTQSSEGRRDVAQTIAAASDCTLPARTAVVRLNRVQRNRQSLLQQLAALAVPRSDEALRAFDLLQKAVQASIAADWHYRDWLLGRKRCGQTGDDFRAALAADGRATRAKVNFLAAFNPLAQRLHQHVWTAAEF